MRKALFTMLFILVLALPCYAAPPTFSGPIPDITIPKNGDYSFDLNTYFTDPDGDTLIFRSTTPSNLGLAVMGSTFSITPKAEWQGVATIVFYANDSESRVESNTVTITVGNPSEAVPEETPVSAPAEMPNVPPSLIDVNPAESPHKMTTAGEKFFLTVMDANGDALTFTWLLDGNVVNGATSEVFDYKNPTVGRHTLKVLIDDGEAQTTYSWTLNVEEGTGSLSGGAIGCGDGVCDAATEACDTCLADCGCSGGDVCDQGVCIAPGGNYVLLFIIIGFGVICLIVLAFFLAKHYSKKKKLEKQNQQQKIDTGITAQDLAFNPGAPAQPEQAPQKPVQAPQKPVQQPQQPAQQPAPQQPAVKPSGIQGPPPTQFDVEKQIMEASKVQSPIDPGMLDYIRKMRELGYQDQSIMDKLKGSGWKESKIKEALKLK